MLQTTVEGMASAGALREDAAARCRHEDTSAGRDAAIRRVLDWYLHSAADANDLLGRDHRPPPLDPYRWTTPPLRFSTGAEALAWLDAEHVSLFTAVTHAAAHGQTDVAWKLTMTMWGYFHRRGPWDE